MSKELLAQPVIMGNCSRDVVAADSEMFLKFGNVKKKRKSYRKTNTSLKEEDLEANSGGKGEDENMTEGVQGGTWDSGKCPCPWQWLALDEFLDPSNPNHSRIL